MFGPRRLRPAADQVAATALITRFQKLETSEKNEKPRRARILRNHTCTDGGGADQPRRTSLRHLFAATERAHYFYRHADRRPRSESGDGANVVLAGGRSGKRYSALHQFAGRLNHRWICNVRHDAVREAGCGNDVRGTGRVNCGGIAGGGLAEEAVRVAKCAGADSPAVDVWAGRAGDGY